MDKGREHFDGIENEYEGMIMKIIPSAEDFFGSVLSFVPEGRIRVLELGSGTGFVTSMLVEKKREMEITCIDLSPAMLEVAKEKPELSGAEFITGDFREVWGEGFYDFVLTTLCLHHLPAEDRAFVIAKIYNSLNKDGVFVNGDVFAAESVNEENLNIEWWRREMINSGFSHKEADLMIQKREDNYAYLDIIPDYTGKLASAGFKDVLLPYKNRIYGVVVGFK